MKKTLDSLPGASEGLKIGEQAKTIRQQTETIGQQAETIRTLEAEVQQLRALLLEAGEVEGAEPTSPLPEIAPEDLVLTDLSHIPKYPGGRNDPFDFLQEHYGSYLKYFGAERDKIYLGQVREHDKALVRRLSKDLSKKRSLEKKADQPVVTPTLSEIVPEQDQLSEEVLPGLLVRDVIRIPLLVKMLRTWIHGQLYR